MTRESILLIVALCLVAVFPVNPFATEGTVWMLKGDPMPTPTPLPVGDLTIYLPGDVPLELMLNPSGSFQMGSAVDEPNRYPDEGPLHTVNITQEFYMGKYEVTQRQWQAVMWYSPVWNYGVGDNYPVYDVSWANCQDFITALNNHIANTGQEPATVRLPTEAEWEYACRAGTQTAYYWGDSWSDDYGWSRANTPQHGSKEVGQKLPNAVGLFDMSGNVLEYCQDQYDSGYYAISPSDDPQGPGLGSGPYRALRGGSSVNQSRYCRSASRGRIEPGFWGSNTGFRIVYTTP